jgi:hypothetical protein
VGDHAILLAALHDVAGLDVYLVGQRDVLDGELADVAGLVQDRELLRQRLLEREEALALDLVFTMDEVDREVLVRVRTRDDVVPERGAPRRDSGRRGTRFARRRPLRIGHGEADVFHAGHRQQGDGEQRGEVGTRHSFPLSRTSS